MPFLAKPRDLPSVMKQMHSSWSGNFMDYASHYTGKVGSSSDLLFSDSDSDEKKVHFSDKVEQWYIPGRESMSPEERSQVWYSIDQHNKTRDNAGQASERAKMECPDYIAAVTRSYRNARFAAMTMESVDSEDLLNNRRSLCKHGKLLLVWSKAAIYLPVTIRGLEDWVCEELYDVREDIAKDAKAMVIQTKRRIDRDSDCDDDSISIQSTLDDDESIARQYSEMTRASAIFARILAIADEVEVAAHGESLSRFSRSAPVAASSKRMSHSEAFSEDNRGARRTMPIGRSIRSIRIAL